MDFRENEVSDHFERGHCFEFTAYSTVYLKH